MSKSRRPRREADHAATTDIVSQLECAIRRPQAALIGALVGGLVPWFARTLAHEEIPATWSDGSRALTLIMIAVVLGCACFSGLSVYKFGLATFGDARKAIGFTLALEGVMLVSHGATSTAALLVLILINALGNGSTIALAREATCRRREADARRATTRARSRSSRLALGFEALDEDTIVERTDGCGDRIFLGHGRVIFLRRFVRGRHIYQLGGGGEMFDGKILTCVCPVPSPTKEQSAQHAPCGVVGRRSWTAHEACVLVQVRGSIGLGRVFPRFDRGARCQVLHESIFQEQRQSRYFDQTSHPGRCALRAIPRAASRSSSAVAIWHSSASSGPLL